MKNISFAIIAITILINSGCQKKLEISNPNTPTTENFWQTPTDALYGVNTMYSTYHRPGLCRNQFFINIIRSDEGYSTSPNATLINNFDRFIVTDYNLWEMRSFWQDCYIGINRANQVLDNVPNITMDETLKSQYIAEAKFMRAFFYYYLAEYWGNVPLQLHTSIPEDVPPTATRDQVWAQIEQDLADATSALPKSYDNANIGRATRGAAYALLGKAYMQQHKYQEAADAFNWLVEGEGKSLYGLTSNYRSNFVEPSENNIESVFEFQYAANPTDNHDDDTYDPDNLNYGTSIPPFFAPAPIGFTDGQARRWIVWEFLKEKTINDERDPRLAASFLYDSTDVRGPEYTIAYGRPWTQLDLSSDPSVLHNNTREVCFRKFLNDSTMNGEVFHSGNNYRYIRYADVLLLYAEALNESGQTAQAYQYVDRVRARAGLPALSAAMPGLGKEAFLAQLKHERITELSGEGHRWEDLERWGDLGPQLASRDEGFSNFTVGKDELLPIPQQDADVNPNLEQNPGW